MVIEKVNVREFCNEFRQSLDSSEVPPSLREKAETALVLLDVMSARLAKNSGNSSKPPSSDQNRIKKQKKKVKVRHEALYIQGWKSPRGSCPSASERVLREVR